MEFNIVHILCLGFAAFYLFIGIICIPIYKQEKLRNAIWVILFWPFLLMVSAMATYATDYPDDYTDEHDFFS